MKCTITDPQALTYLKSGTTPLSPPLINKGQEARWCIFCGMPFEEAAESEWYCCPKCRKEKYGAEE